MEEEEAVEGDHYLMLLRAKMVVGWMEVRKVMHISQFYCVEEVVAEVEEVVEEPLQWLWFVKLKFGKTAEMNYMRLQMRKVVMVGLAGSVVINDVWSKQMWL